MAEEVNLYLLVFPDRRLVKIGQAVDVFKRSQSFAWLGVPDYTESYRVPVPPTRINSIEKGLHRLLSGYRVTDFAEKGDGHTEIFELDALGVALEIVQLLAKHDGSLVDPHKGVEVPPVAGAIELRSRDHKLHKHYRILSRKAAEHYSDTIASSENFRYINRLVLFLYRYQFKIPFTYERCGDRLTFSVHRKYVPKPDSEKFKRLWRIFGFSFTGLDYRSSSAALTGVKGYQGEMLSFEIDLSGHGARESIPHQAQFTMGLFEKLPQTSAAFEVLEVQ